MAPSPTPKPQAVTKKLPLWAWGAAAALGIVIGLVFFKRDSAAAAADDSSPAAGTAAAAGEDGSGGTVAIPPELLAALGLRPSAGGAASNEASGPSAPPAPAEAPAPAPAPAQTQTASWDQLVAGGQTNEQLPPSLQLEGVDPSAAVISSYFDRKLTISGPGSAPVIETVKAPKPGEVGLPSGHTSPKKPLLMP